MADFNATTVKAIKAAMRTRREAFESQDLDFIQVVYSGSHDDGTVDDIYPVPTKAAYRPSDKQNGLWEFTIPDSIKDLLEILVPQDGFGNGAGGGGDVRVYPDGRMLHNPYFNAKVDNETNEEL